MAREASSTPAPPGDRRLAARERLAHNPFFVLGLAPDAARAEIEREGQKLLGMLELGLSAAQRYRSPLGEHERTTERVREALAELRDPDRRLVHELWARHAPVGEIAAELEPGAAEPRASTEPNAGVEPDTLATFAGLARLGFARRRR